MKNLLIALGILLVTSCSKVDEPKPPHPITTALVCRTNTLDSFSAINKTTPWYTTTRAMTGLFDVSFSKYWDFELLSNSALVLYNTNTTKTWSASKNYCWNDLGTYLYTDFNGDGRKDLWAYYWKKPWPTNALGLHLYSEYEKSPNTYDLKVGLTQVRKCVVSDMDNDQKPDIMLFSSGYDSTPFPSDFLGIFYPKETKYQYLSQDIGYFHGGATGDINNDGLIDIVAYSGSSLVIPVNPTCYINKGGRNFELNNKIFKNFTQMDNYYTIELFDIIDDGKLDLFLGGSETLMVVLNKMDCLTEVKRLI